MTLLGSPGDLCRSLGLWETLPLDIQNGITGVQLTVEGNRDPTVHVRSVTVGDGEARPRGRLYEYHRTKDGWRFKVPKKD